MSRSKKKSRRKKTAPHSLIPTTIQIACIHLLILASLVFLTIKYQIPLYDDSNSPTGWLTTLQFIYYAFPFVLSFIFGMVFRPFWPQFRNLLIIILMVYMTYSLFAYGMRLEHIRWIDEQVHQAQLRELVVERFKHSYQSHKGTGLVDSVIFHARVDASQMTEGSYGITGQLTQKGKPLPKNYMGVAKFVVSESAPKKFKLRFGIDPQFYDDYFDRGSFEVDIKVYKEIPVTKRGDTVIGISRWAPFFKYTGWNGYDRDISKRIVELQSFLDVDSFSLLPLDLSRRDVRFERFHGDEGVDENGDGLFDKLVLIIEFISDYNGLVTIQADIEGAPYSVAQQVEIRKGANVIKYFIDGKRLHEFGLDGPYEFINFHLFKENPFCRGDECRRHIKAAFRVYFDNYLSKEYRLSQFSRQKL